MLNSANIPDRYKYQLNHQDATRNYIEQKTRLRERWYFDKADLQKTVETALDEILKSLETRF